jgi:hypothetical protein
MNATIPLQMKKGEVVYLRWTNADIDNIQAGRKHRIKHNRMKARRTESAITPQHYILLSAIQGMSGEGFSYLLHRFIGEVSVGVSSYVIFAKNIWIQQSFPFFSIKLHLAVMGKNPERGCRSSIAYNISSKRLFSSLNVNSGAAATGSPFGPASAIRVLLWAYPLEATGPGRTDGRQDC